MFVQRRRPGSPLAPETLAALSRVQVTTLGHRTDLGFPRGLRPLVRPVSFAGPAVTVHVPHLDSTAMHCALDVAQPGDVLVVDQSGDVNRSCFGGTVGYAAKHRGVVGVVIDSRVNDYAELVELGLPIFCRGVTALTSRVLGIEGAINVAVSVGGVAVRPGDVIVGDDDGVAVIAPDRVELVARDLVEREARSAAKSTHAKLAAGASLAHLSGARELFEKSLDAEAGQ